MANGSKKDPHDTLEVALARLFNTEEERKSFTYNNVEECVNRQYNNPDRDLIMEQIFLNSDGILRSFFVYALYNKGYKLPDNWLLDERVDLSLGLKHKNNNLKPGNPVLALNPEKKQVLYSTNSLLMKFALKFENNKLPILMRNPTFRNSSTFQFDWASFDGLQLKPWFKTIEKGRKLMIKNKIAEQDEAMECFDRLLATAAFFVMFTKETLPTKFDFRTLILKNHVQVDLDAAISSQGVVKPTRDVIEQVKSRLAEIFRQPSGHMEIPLEFLLTKRKNIVSSGLIFYLTNAVRKLINTGHFEKIDKEKLPDGVTVTKKHEHYKILKGLMKYMKEDKEVHEYLSQYIKF